jgi:hypothetical protein
VAEEGKDCLRVRLEPGARLDRDFILRFQLGSHDPANPIGSSLTLHPDGVQDGQAGTFALTLVPTRGLEQVSRPRDIVFVLDRSGSMAGWKIVAARRAMARMIDSLGEGDRFCLLAFDNAVETPAGGPPGLSPATDRLCFRTQEYLARIEARGGTEMAQPLRQAAQLLVGTRQRASGRVPAADRPRESILVLVTDGQVGNEDQILQELGPALALIRVFTLGIDRAVNAGFLRRLAELGKGACELVESERRLDEVMAAIHRQIGTPLLSGLTLEPEGFTLEPDSLVPEQLPDLFAAAPVLLLGRFRGRPEGSLSVRATDSIGNPWSQILEARPRDNPAIASAWARGQVRKLEDRYVVSAAEPGDLERQIVAVSLRHGVLSRFTAYSAIDRSETANTTGRVHQVTQPVESPQGWADHASLGLALHHNSVIGYSCMDFGLARASSPEALSDLACGPPESNAGMVFRREARRIHRAPETSTSQPSAPLPTDAAAGAHETDQIIPAAPGVEPGLPDQYLIKGRFGRGGIGSVYVAYDQSRGHVVALNVVPARFRNAGYLPPLSEVLPTLSHPSIERILEIGSRNDIVYMVTEFPGPHTTLTEILVRRSPVAGEAARWVAEIAEAVHYLHEHGLLHWDVKPQRIAINPQGRAILNDLASHALLAGSEPKGVCGTPAYMPPELLAAGPTAYDIRSTIYSLGVVLYELLSGVLPFTARSTTVLFWKLQNETPRPPRSIRRAIPKELESICLKAMARKPEDRYSTAGELAGALRSFLSPHTKLRKSFWKRG